MQRFVPIGLALAVCASMATAAEPRVVSQEDLDAALARASAGRNADLALIEGTLASPAAHAVIRRFGFEPRRAGAALSSLADGELRALAVQAEAVRSVRATDDSMAAGLANAYVPILLVLLALVVLLVVLIAKA